MWEQNGNIFNGSGFKAFVQMTRLLMISFLVLAVSACVPSGEQDVNTELFKSKDDMRERAATLRPGMNKKDVFEKLGISPDRFTRLNTADLQTCVYGNSQVQGSPEQLEQFRKRMSSYEAYTLPYREIKASSSLGFGKMRVEKTGYDLKLTLVFDSGRLFRASVEGTEEVKQQEDQYLWDSLLRRGLGAAF